MIIQRKKSFEPVVITLTSEEDIKLMEAILQFATSSGITIQEFCASQIVPYKGFPSVDALRSEAQVIYSLFYKEVRK